MIRLITACLLVAMTSTVVTTVEAIATSRHPVMSLIMFRSLRAPSGCAHCVGRHRPICSD